MIKCVAVIGLGSIAKRHRKNLKLRFPGVKILVMSASGRTPNESVENADEIVAEIELLINAKPEFVIVASPATSHVNHALALMKNGIPVLIEKPVAATSIDAVRLIEASKSYKTPASVAYCLRYLSSSLEMKRLLKQGRIGTVYNAFINVGQYLPDWRKEKNYRDSVSAKASLGGGVLLELSHELDYMQWLLGDMTCQYAQLRTSSELGLEVEEIADIMLASASGVVCNLHLDFLQKQAHRKCMLIGSDGRLEWDLIENSIKLFTASGNSTLFSEPGWDKNKMYLAMLDDFVSLKDKQDNSCIDLPQAEKIIGLIEQIKEQAIWGVEQ